MKSQQQAEKEEQQRIKNLVLNYDLQQSEDQEGKSKAAMGEGVDDELTPMQGLTIDCRRSTRIGPRSRVRIGDKESGSCS